MVHDDRFVQTRGGVTAARGFKASAVHCGIKPGNATERDLALVCSDRRTAAAAVFTTNKIKAAPVRVSASHLRAADIRAVALNSGNANACTGVEGLEHAKRMARAVADAMNVRERQVLVCSTGRIGVPLPVERIEAGAAPLVAGLKRRHGGLAARAIMTSDTRPKQFAVAVSARNGRVFKVGGMAKGAGMINPNMATMLCVVTTDLPVAKANLQRALGVAVEASFNRITVDGDMSTNDTVIALANGAAGGEEAEARSADFIQFQEALTHVTRHLARMIVEDGEGVSRFVEVRVTGAATFADARTAAEAIANSSLVKCAWFGGDPNWGRIVDAVGYSGAAVREEMVDVYYNGLIAVRGGVASSTPRSKLEEIVREKRFTVHVCLHRGSAEYVVYTTDLTPAYVRLNRGE